jgi:hypothetical protein
MDKHTRTDCDRYDTVDSDGISGKDVMVGLAQTVLNAATNAQNEVVSSSREVRSQ